MKLTLQPLNTFEEHNQFLTHPEVADYIKFYHSWHWGEFQKKLGKPIQRLGFYEGTQLVATALLVEERNRFGRFYYCPRGPLLNYSNTSLTSEVLASLVDHAKSNTHIAYLRLDPALKADSSEAKLLPKLGFKPAARWFVQVGRAWVVDIAGKSDEQLVQWLSEHGMRSNVPRYLRKAARAGVNVRSSDSPQDLEVSLAMLAALDNRKGGIGTFPPDYYRQQFAAMAPAGLEKIFVAELDGQPLASALIALCGQEASYLHGASYDLERDLHAPQFMHIEIMKYARDHGASKYNFWGVVGDNNFHPGHYGYGYSAFKKSFGGYTELYMPAQDYVFKPLPYKLVHAKEKYDVTRHKID
jgi:peptidoglycan pentaglycine glycine transferase (the first glycine)